MLKRPLLFVVIAFVLGEVCLQYNSKMAVVVILGSVLVEIFALRIIRSQKYLRWLLVLPLFLFAGAFLLSMEKREEFFSKEQDASSCLIEGRIKDIEEKENGLAVTLEKVSIRDRASVKRMKAQVLVYGIKEHRLKIGQRIECEGELVLIPLPSNPGQFHSKNYYGARGIKYFYFAKEIRLTDSQYCWYKEQLRRFRRSLIDTYCKILKEEDAGVVTAMVTGDKNLLLEEQKSMYEQNGIAHILAISGLHVSLIGQSLFRLLRKRGCSYGMSGCMCGGFILLYGVFTGMGGSTLRAVIMLLLAFLAEFLGRSYDLFSASALSALFMLIEYPLRLFDGGFLLSFGAVLSIGILLVTTQKLSRLKGLFMSMGIQVFLLPVTVFFYHEIPLYAGFLNLIVIPLVGIVLPFAMIGGVIGLLALFLGKFLLIPAVVCLKLFSILCSAAERLPFHSITIGEISYLQIAAYYSVVLLLCLMIRKRKWLACLWITAGVMGILFMGGEKPLLIVFADVGQGDGIFMKAPDGTSILLDGGSTDTKEVGKYRLLPLMKYYGVVKLDYAVITHMDEDHISGIRELIDMGRIDTLILPKLSAPDQVYENMIMYASQNSTKVLYISTGDQITIGEIRFLCLHPSVSYVTDSKNDGSTVLQMDYRNFRVLFTGDLEEEGEQYINKWLKDCDLLKVAHHGSRFSTKEDFLEKVKPEIAVISSGRNNRYGHPHEELLNRLYEYGSAVYRTQEKGAVVIKSDGQKLRIKGWL